MHGRGRGTTPTEVVVARTAVTNRSAASCHRAATGAQPWRDKASGAASAWILVSHEGVFLFRVRHRSGVQFLQALLCASVDQTVGPAGAVVRNDPLLQRNLGQLFGFII